MLLAATVMASSPTQAQDQLTRIEQLLDDAPVQEKVYLHLDNNCYYKGDDIWYKAYVVRADDNTYTDMSRLLYVELVSPDGMLVERQTVVVSADGHGQGSFNLTDSLYSGYYELRAYTRWMMNFCVTEHPSQSTVRNCFYNDQMAHDFFRLFGTVYSRVVPVYERPEKKGDYTQKYIISRPKTRLDKEVEQGLSVSFYPEGGHLIAGTRCNVAFEALNEEGEQVNVKGTVGTTTIKSEHQGRGSFTIDVPEKGNLKAVFNYNGRECSFKLPKTEDIGCALTMKNDDTKATASVQLHGVSLTADFAAIVLSRGMLKQFQRFRPDSKGSATISIDINKLPTGVADLIIVDNEGTPMADRLFFVNHHDYEQGHIVATLDSADYGPYAPVTLTLQTPAGTDWLSVSVRDAATDDPSYDTGNMMTELLLSSELKGFIPHPDYFFEADDEQHRRHLDLLMMVQGWRRYDYAELTADKPLRYRPEQRISVEGCVYPMAAIDDYSPEEVRYWNVGVFGYDSSKSYQFSDGENSSKNLLEEELKNRLGLAEDGLPTTGEEASLDAGTAYLTKSHEAIHVTTATDQVHTGKESMDSNSGQVVLSMEDIRLDMEPGVQSKENLSFGVERGGLRNEVTVECELVQVDDKFKRKKGTQVVTQTVETDHGGHFHFDLPAYAGYAVLFLRAYKTDISERQKHNLDTKDRMNEEADPDFYVKRSLFFPIFAKKYSYYQCHVPEDEDDSYDLPAFEELADEERLSSMDRTLKEVTVKRRRRRGRHAIDYTKPVGTYDTQELYNLCTDYGLSYGKFSMESFPVNVSIMLLGTYNEDRFFNVQARYNDGMNTPYIFYRNFSPDMSSGNVAFNSEYQLANNLKLARQDEIRFFSDFELRNEEKPVVMQNNTADVTLEFKLMPDGGKRYVYRDRRIILPGIAEQYQYYHPNYNQRKLPPDYYDYRRTLYWNATAQPDENGQLQVNFYNNGKRTRMQVSVAGIGPDGQPLYY